MFSRFKTELLFIVAGVAVLAVLFAAQWYDLGRNGGTNYVTTVGVPLDDVYIHCRYAENLLAGNGYSFNPPTQVTADTSPLWVVLIAFGGLFTLHLEVIAVLFSSLAWLLIAPAVYRVAKYVFNFEEVWAVVAGIISLLGGRMLIMAPSGMETTLASLLTLIAVEIHIRSRDTLQIRIREAVVLGLAIATRPELYLLAAIAAIDWLILLSKNKVSVKSFAGFSAVLTVFFAAVLSLPYMERGSLSYHSSVVQGAGFRLLPDVYYLLRSFGILVEMYAIIFLLGAFEVFHFPKIRARHAVLLIFIVGLPLAQAFIAPQYRHFGRYIFPIFPLCTLCVVAFVKKSSMHSPTWLAKTFGFTITGNIRKIIIVLITIVMLNISFRWITNYGGAVSNINDQHLAAVAWVNANLSPNDIIAADDVGALGFFTKRNIIDLTGLVSPEMYPLQHNQQLVWKAARSKGANIFIIYTRLNPTFYQYASDSLELVKELPVRKPLVSSADSVMSIFKVKGAHYAAR